MGKGTSTLACALTACAFMTGAGAAGASTASGECGRAEEFRDIRAEGNTCIRADGAHVHRFADGTTAISHGPDPRGEEAAGHLSDIPAPNGTKAVNCATASQYRGRAIFTYPSDRSNRATELKDEFRRVIKQGNAFLNAEATFTGSGTSKAVLKFNCNSDNDIDINVEQFGFSGANGSFTKIVDALKNRGYNDPETIYWVYYDDFIPDACGQGSVGYTTDGLRSKPPAGPIFGATYRGCIHWGTPLHEAFHNMGAVQNTAPRASGRWHCNDGLDLMCYADGGSTSNYRSGVCGNVQIDCGMNDYFHPKPSSGTYPYSHWNVGFCANAYILRDGCITAPQAFTATRRLTGGADLMWQAPLNNGGSPVKRYEIFRASCASCTFSHTFTTTNKTYYDSAPGLTSNYWYKVRAVNQWEDISAFSNTDDAASTP